MKMTFPARAAHRERNTDYGILDLKLQIVYIQSCLQLNTPRLANRASYVHDAAYQSF